MNQSRGANWFAVIWAGGVPLCLLYLPAVLLPVLAPARTTYELTPTGRVTRYTEGTVGILDGEGPAAYLSALLPFLITLLPLLVWRSVPWRRVVSAVATVGVGLYVVLGAMTIGLLYIPALVSLALAAVGAADRVRETAV